MKSLIETPTPYLWKTAKQKGLFLAVKHCLNPVGKAELASESEIIWAKIDLPGLKIYSFAVLQAKRKWANA